MLSLVAALALAVPGPTAVPQAVHPPLPPARSGAEGTAVPPGPGAALGVLGPLESPLIDGRSTAAPRSHWSHWWITERPSALGERIDAGRSALPEDTVKRRIAPRLVGLLAADTTKDVRAAALLALGRVARRLDDQERSAAVALIVAQLNDADASRELRGAAAVALGLDAGDEAVAALLAVDGAQPIGVRSRIALALGIAAFDRAGETGLQQAIALRLMSGAMETRSPVEHAASLAALGLVELPLAPSIPSGALRSDPQAPFVASRAALASWLRRHLSRGRAMRGADAVVRSHGLVALARIATGARAGTWMGAVRLLAQVVDPRSSEDERVRAAAIGSLALIGRPEGALDGLRAAAAENAPLTSGLAAMALGRLDPAWTGATGPQRTWLALGRVTGSGGSAPRGSVDPGLWTSGAGIAIALGLEGEGPWWAPAAALTRAIGELGGAAGPSAAGHAALACGLMDSTDGRRALDRALAARWNQPEVLHGVGLALLAAGTGGFGKQVVAALESAEDPRVEAVAAELLGAGPGASVLDELLALTDPEAPRAGAVTAIGLLAAGRDEAWRRTLWRGHPYLVDLGVLRGGDGAGRGLLDAP